MEELVETVVTAQTEAKQLRMQKSFVHEKCLDCNDQVSKLVADAIRQEIAQRAGHPLDKVVINWEDARPMSYELEMGEDGRLFVSTKLVHKMSIETGMDTTKYLKLTGGDVRRRALTGPLIRRFERAWQDTKQLGDYATVAPKVLKSMEKLGDFAVDHEEDVLEMMRELEESGIGSEGLMVLEE